MLIPASLKKNEIIDNIKKIQYTNDMYYWVGQYENVIPDISEEPDKNTFQFAVVNSKNILIGYISYKVDWYNSSAYNFGIISFNKGNAIFGKDLLNVMNKLICEYKLHRIEWWMLGGNPVERHYDKLCKKYNGKKIILTDVIKDSYGKYHDSMIYEIINKEVRK